MTAFASVETALREAFKLGADDFIQKPFDVEELKLIVRKTLEKQELIVENRAFKRAQRDRGSVKNIVGTSSKMDAIFQMIETVAEVQSTVLITGESGTGKELVARAIHDQSPRGERPFISINCGAFTETLLESELFGYVKGAFTGANTNRKGLFEAADKGTIFLDEIGEMSPAMVVLLRVLQERRTWPVGAHEEMSIDARVIAATNRDLKQMSDDGTFREDLFYRISVIPIHLPPLRDRAEDIPGACRSFYAEVLRSERQDADAFADRDAVVEKIRVARERSRAGAHDRSGPSLSNAAKRYSRSVCLTTSQVIIRSVSRPNSICRTTVSIWSATSKASKRPTLSRPCVSRRAIKQRPPSFCKCRWRLLEASTR